MKVKICGITREEDAAAAAAAGAASIGIVFYPPSKRFVKDLGLAQAIALAAGPLTNVVGLFVDAEATWIDEVLSHVAINTLQFHGNEDVSACTKYRRPYIKALRIRDSSDPLGLAESFKSASGILLDSYVAGVPGGTGQSFNWNLFPRESRQHFILEGGLTPANVAEAIRVTSPAAVDVSGGVESSPGIKDPSKISQFIAQATARAETEY